MKKQLLTERFQQLAGIKPLYAINRLNEENTNDGFKWLKSVNMANLADFQGINNLPTNMLSDTLPKFFNYVMKQEDSRDWGDIMGDKAIVYLKTKYLDAINRISDPNIREFLKSPKVSSVGGLSKFDDNKVAELVKANTFTDNIPEIPGSNYIGNNKEFTSKIETSFTNMIEESIKNNYIGLLPFLIPYMTFMWKKHIVNKMSNDSIK